MLSASFHADKPSSLTHSKRSPTHVVPRPEAIQTKPSEEDPKDIYREIVKAAELSKVPTRVNPAIAWARENGLEFLQSLSKEYVSRPIDYRYVSNLEETKDGLTGNTEHRQYVWFRTNGPTSTDPNTNALALVYASDHDLINTAIQAHGDLLKSDIKVMVSLNHSVYFHTVCPFPKMQLRTNRPQKWMIGCCMRLSHLGQGLQEP